jgi:hypothetical protein
MRLNLIRIILLILIISLISGCNIQKQNDKDVSRIKLECIQLCLEMKEKPFEEKEYSDSDSIALFIKALNESKKMQGILDYGAIFVMTLYFKDGSQNSYHLNIGNTDEAQKGLLIKLPDTEQGYEIPENISNELKKLIYNS